MKKILIVDDEAAPREILRGRFVKEGFQVLEATNGQEGLEAVQAHHPDIILVDIVMPVMDGITMLMHLQEDPSTKDIPALVMTNLTSSEAVSLALKQGVHNYLVKTDWTVEDILNKIKTTLEK